MLSAGSPPLAHNEPITTIIDEDLLQYDQIWAAAGTPKAVFMIAPDQLVQATGGKVQRSSRPEAAFHGRARRQGRGLFRTGPFFFFRKPFPHLPGKPVSANLPPREGIMKSVGLVAKPGHSEAVVLSQKLIAWFKEQGIKTALDPGLGRDLGLGNFTPPSRFL